RGPNLDPLEQVERNAEHVGERRADHIAVADEHDSLSRMPGAQAFEGADDPRLHLRHELPPAGAREASKAVEAPPRGLLLERVEPSRGPVAELELRRVLADLHLEPQGA